MRRYSAVSISPRFYDARMRTLRIIFGIPFDLITMAIAFWPGELGFFLRYRFWKGRLRFLGKSVRIDTGVTFQNPEFISIDDNCWIDRGVIILAGLDKALREKIVITNSRFPGEPGVVIIGKNVHVAPNCIVSGISAGVYISDYCGISADCKIFAFSHHYRSKKNPEDESIHFAPMVPAEKQCMVEGAIFLGRNTGVALNSVILPGASIPENCFVSINSVVSGHHYSPNSIISGSPAKGRGQRFLRSSRPRAARLTNG